jgi:hypothetical protein
MDRKTEPSPVLCWGRFDRAHLCPWLYREEAVAVVALFARSFDRNSRQDWPTNKGEQHPPPMNPSPANAGLLVSCLHSLHRFSASRICPVLTTRRGVGRVPPSLAVAFWIAQESGMKGLP